MLEQKAIETIQQTAVKAHGNRIHTSPAEPSNVYYIEDADGEFQRVTAARQFRKHQITSIDSIIGCANKAATSDDKTDEVSIWCSINGVEAVLGSNDLDRAKLALTPSVQFQTLKQWAESGIFGQLVDHVSTYTLLRTIFRESLPGHSSILDDIRKVDVNKASQAAGEVSRTNVSISKKLIAEASGADRLPEVLTFHVPVFAQAAAPVKSTVRVAFDLDPQQEKFRFIVLPGEIEAAIHEAETWLFKQIADKVGNIPVYFGTP